MLPVMQRNHRRGRPWLWPEGAYLRKNRFSWSTRQTRRPRGPPQDKPGIHPVMIPLHTRWRQPRLPVADNRCSNSVFSACWLFPQRTTIEGTSQEGRTDSRRILARYADNPARRGIDRAENAEYTGFPMQSGLATPGMVQKGAGAVVRSTRPTFGRCPAVPTTIPDPSLNPGSRDESEWK